MLSQAADSNSPDKSSSRFKVLFQEFIQQFPFIACGLLAGFYVIEWGGRIGAMGSLAKRSQLSSDEDCSVDFWDAFVKSVGQVSVSISGGESSGAIPLELASGTLSIVALLELMGIILEVVFIIEPVYKGISYVFVILFGGVSKTQRELISKILQHMLLPGSFSNFAVGTWIQINTVDSYPCIGSALRQSPVDSSLVWMYLLNSLFRSIIVIYMLVAFVLGPICGIRKPFAAPAEELDEFLAFYRQKLASELIANQNLKTITYRTVLFDFMVTYQKNITVTFYTSGKIILVNLFDIISNNMSFETLQQEIEAQYRNEQTAETKTYRRLAVAYFVFQTCIMLIGFGSGGYLFLIT